MDEYACPPCVNRPETQLTPYFRITLPLVLFMRRTGRTECPSSLSLTPYFVTLPLGYCTHLQATPHPIFSHNPSLSTVYATYGVSLFAVSHPLSFPVLFVRRAECLPSLLLALFYWLASAYLYSTVWSPGYGFFCCLCSLLSLLVLVVGESVKKLRELRPVSGDLIFIFPRKFHVFV